MMQLLVVELMVMMMPQMGVRSLRQRPIAEGRGGAIPQMEVMMQVKRQAMLKLKRMTMMTAQMMTEQQHQMMMEQQHQMMMGGCVRVQRSIGRVCVQAALQWGAREWLSPTGAPCVSSTGDRPVAPSPWPPGPEGSSSQRGALCLYWRADELQQHHALMSSTRRQLLTPCRGVHHRHPLQQQQRLRDWLWACQALCAPSQRVRAAPSRPHLRQQLPCAACSAPRRWGEWRRLGRVSRPSGGRRVTDDPRQNRGRIHPTAAGRHQLCCAQLCELQQLP